MWWGVAFVLGWILIMLILLILDSPRVEDKLTGVLSASWMVFYKKAITIAFSLTLLVGISIMAVCSLVLYGN